MNTLPREPFESPADEQEMVCPICGESSGRCEQPDDYDDGVWGHEVEGHRGKWVTEGEWEEEKAMELRSDSYGERDV